MTFTQRLPVIGSGSARLLMTTAFFNWFDVGFSDTGLPVIRFAYVYVNGAGKHHIQVAQVVPGATGDVCEPIQSTEARITFGSSAPHQQFWPTVDFADRSVLDTLTSPGLEWQLTYFSTHNVVDINGRYLQPIGSTLTDSRLSNVVPLVPGPNFVGPSDNYVCASIAPGGAVLPDIGYWGDYFHMSQRIVPAVSTGVFNAPGWLNVAAFPYSAPRPLGQASPCVREDVLWSDPHHVSAFAWPSFRF